MPITLSNVDLPQPEGPIIDTNSPCSISILILSMLLITVGEMMAFPFTNNFAMNRAPIGKEGDYMAWYSMAFSLSHIFSAKVGMELIEKYGYDFNWYVMGGLGSVAMFLIYRLRGMLAEEKAVTSVKLDVSSSLEENLDVDPNMSVRAVLNSNDNLNESTERSS